MKRKKPAVSTVSGLLNTQLWSNKILREATREMTGFQEIKEIEPMRPFVKMGNDSFTFEHEEFIIEVKLTRTYTPDGPNGSRSRLVNAALNAYVHAPPPSSKWLHSRIFPLMDEMDRYTNPDDMLRESLPYLVEKAKEKLWEKLADGGKSDTVGLGNVRFNARK